MQRRPLAATAIFWTAFALHLVVLAGRLVDFPYLDEWDYITPAALGRWPQLSFLLRQHSDHLMVTTHLQVWALCRAAGFNLATGGVFNYLFFFGLIPLLLARIGRRQLGESNWMLWLLLLALLTPFSPYHAFGLLMVSLEHYPVLLLASALLLFGEAQRTRDVVFGALAAALATLSVGAGAVSSAVTLVVYGAFKHARSRRGARPRRELAQWAVAAALIAPVVAYWFLRHQPVAGRPPLTWPLAPEYWRWLGALCALGLARPGEVAAGAALLLAALLPVALTWRELVEARSTAWVRLVLAGSVVACAGVTTAVRAGFGFSRAVEVWHYHGLVVLLVPLAALGWFATAGERRYPAVFAAFAAALALLMGPSFTTAFHDTRQERVLAGRRCVVEKLALGEPVVCPAAFHSPLDAKLALARERGLSFVRDLDADVGVVHAVLAWNGDTPYVLGTPLDFRTGGNAARFEREGWSAAEPWATWTVGDEARLLLPLDGGVPGDLELEAVVTPLVADQRPTLEADVLVNGTRVARWGFVLADKAGTVRTAAIPAAVASALSPLELRLRIGDPRSPADLGRTDTRPLGLAFTRLVLRGGT